MKSKVVIRPATEADAKAILEIYAPYILHTPVSFEMVVPDLQDFRNRIRKYQEKLPWLVCVINGKLAGYAYATDHRQRKAYDCTKELSLYVHEDFRGLGIATGLYTALMGILKHQGITNVLAGITLPNPESVGFHEKYGFNLVGIYHKVGYKMGRYHDAGWWELEIGNNTSFREEIIPAGAIIQSSDGREAIRNGISKIKPG